MIKLPFHADGRCLRKFLFIAIFGGIGTLIRHRRRMKKGVFFPPFQFISITDQCNLHCQGCWVVGKKNPGALSVADIDGIVAQGKQNGSRFFGILGGEPLTHTGLFDVFRRNGDCYFQLFTNGTLLDEAACEELRKCANVTPLISLEGDETVSDVRRGGEGVFRRTTDGIDNAIKAGLLVGVAISVCRSNLELALSDAFIKSLIDRKVSYLWYYIYRPVGGNPMPELALSVNEINRLRRHLIDARCRFPIVIVDSYWDEDGKPFCPAAIGLSHHVNASGNVEPCPVIQFSADNIRQKPLAELYASSSYLAAFRVQVPLRTNGCILMEDPAWLASFVDVEGASDSSGRDNERARLLTMSPVDSHGSAEIIPERGFFYRLVKKNAFFGFGAYG